MLVGQVRSGVGLGVSVQAVGIGLCLPGSLGGAAENQPMSFHFLVLVVLIAWRFHGELVHLIGKGGWGIQKYSKYLVGAARSLEPVCTLTYELLFLFLELGLIQDIHQ